MGEDFPSVLRNTKAILQKGLSTQRECSRPCVCIAFHTPGSRATEVLSSFIRLFERLKIVNFGKKKNNNFNYKFLTMDPGSPLGFINIMKDDIFQFLT